MYAFSLDIIVIEMACFFSEDNYLNQALYSFELYVERLSSNCNLTRQL